MIGLGGSFTVSLHVYILRFYARMQQVVVLVMIALALSEDSLSKAKLRADVIRDLALLPINVKRALMLDGLVCVSLCSPKKNILCEASSEIIHLFFFLSHPTLGPFESDQGHRSRAGRAAEPPGSGPRPQLRNGNGGSLESQGSGAHAL